MAARPAFPDTRTGRAAKKLVRRRTLWVALLAFVPAVAAMAVVACGSGRHAFMPFVQVFYWMPMYLSISYNQFTARRFHARLAAHDYRLCCFCGYDLRNIPEYGRCPECGEWYDIRVTREEWIREGPRL